MGSPSAVLSAGFGSWGSVGEVITLGFGANMSSIYGWLEYSAIGPMHFSASDQQNSYTAQGVSHFSADGLGSFSAQGPAHYNSEERDGG